MSVKSVRVPVGVQVSVTTLVVVAVDILVTRTFRRKLCMHSELLKVHRHFFLVVCMFSSLATV